MCELKSPVEVTNNKMQSINSNNDNRYIFQYQKIWIR